MRISGINGFNSGGNVAYGGIGDDNVKPGYKSAPGECQACRTRKYKDGSDENVSFKSGTHISPTQSGAAVRAHENEHVQNAYLKASEKGGKVLSVGVSIHTAVCEECGRVYVAGGTTRSLISTPKDENNPYEKQKNAFLGEVNKGMRADFAV